MTTKNSEIQKSFLMVGNGTYQNRGCEAIVRGTAEILRSAFGEDIKFNIGIYDTLGYLPDQIRLEKDISIKSFPLKWAAQRWSREWFELQFNKHLGSNFPSIHSTLKPYLKKSVCALEIGGDTYSLDYGIPWHYVNMDRYLQKHHLPLILWGASVGPFDKNQEFASVMFENLRSFDAIFVRETISRDYLAKNNVQGNVYVMADPAFVMPSEKPIEDQIGFDIPKDAIGLNFSPLIAKYFLNKQVPIWEMKENDLKPWINFCVEIVIKLAEKTNRDIILIPHVENKFVHGNDVQFLKKIAQLAATQCKQNIFCLSGQLSASEIKWVISQCFVFAGARTHSTIAALSSEIPTLSIGYSVKAQGINQDIFGCQDFCINSKTLTQDLFIERMMDLISQESHIRKVLKENIPKMRSKALLAGVTLKKVLKEREGR
ncbi:MAG: hypothetical protein HEQ29_06355 [Dolichospermum sp. LBC05a]|nr:polysaccharide pyruvyl transferase family protein [Dolichospermum sp. OL01]MCO5796411.1 polysaccharide pyruvyl transferase family protein [Dolichospermum sp. OL03]MCS6281619.1 polysaccharide pyruvyl transferase family protein [Dolichospermum sp.]QSV58020.1 MAG: hypothetical protein HEQ29_06355 [Dolichospermum sp. LBC05a]